MNRTTCFTHAKRLALGLAALALAAAPSFAQTTIDLCATTGSVTMPDGVIVPIWGYVLGPACTPGTATIPGPVLRPTPGDTTLTVNLNNNLPEPVSFFVPGLRATAVGGIAGKFTAEVAAGGAATYTVDLTGRSGTFLYHSATDRIRTQVPMGLYGALVVDTPAGEAYPGVPYTQDAVLVYSEIDPSLTATSGGARVSKVDDRVADGFDATESGWVPRYFLINGQAYPGTTPLAVNTGNVLLRFVNAGLDSVMPTLDGGLYLDVIAEDGNVYPHPMLQYGLELQAGKTIDAMVTVGTPGSYALYDRSGRLTNAAATGGGMLTYLNASAGAGLFELGAATYSVAENVVGGTLTVTVNRVGGAAGAVSVDYATADGTATVAGLDYAAAAGTLNFLDTQTSATFDITITDDIVYEGDETFSVSLSNALGGASIGTPSSAVVTITEDDPGPGVLQLSAATYSVAENGGTLTVTVDRVDGTAGAASVNFATANGTATAPADYTATSGILTWIDGDGVSKTFAVSIVSDTTYEGDETFNVNLSGAVGATLGAPASAVATIVEDDPAPNVAPFANDDLAAAPKNSPGITFSVTANDVDPDGTIDVTTVVITTGPSTAFGGTVVENNDGTVTFVPRRGFSGTDVFQYTVNDDDGATSNVATVRVNVS